MVLWDLYAQLKSIGNSSCFGGPFVAGTRTRAFTAASPLGILTSPLVRHWDKIYHSGKDKWEIHLSFNPVPHARQRELRNDTFSVI